MKAPLYHHMNFMIWRSVMPEYATPSTLCAVMGLRHSYPVSMLRWRLRRMDRNFDTALQQQLKWKIGYEIVTTPPWWKRLRARLRLWWSTR